MRNILKSVVISLAILGLAGCANMNNQDVGTIAGGAIGGLLGNQIGGGGGRIIATIGGTLLGAYLGNQVGANMDKTDRLAMEQNVQRAMNDNKAVAWRGHTGDRYRVVPGRRERRDERRCRRYTMYAYMGGERKRIHGLACYRHGRWVNVS